MIFPAIKSAILRATGAQVEEVFASSDQICVEMADLANEVADDIAKSADWRVLTKVATLSVAGVEDHPLPSDYDRMVLASEVDDPGTWFWGYQPFESVNEWMRYKNGGFQLIAPGGWIILGGGLKFYPAPSGTATFPYISNAWAVDVDGVPKQSFTADDDAFLLPNSLLTLGLIWRWRQQKRLEYAEDMQNYEAALSQAQGRDKGAYVLATPRRMTRSTTMAYTGRAIR